jgi:hypothetical protein
MNASAPWLLLVASLPTAGATARMRLWRALKAMGCAALRDGAYLLPHSAAGEEALASLAAHCQQEGGSAWVMAAAPQTQEMDQAWRALFDRSEDYAVLRRQWKDAGRQLKQLGAAELSRLQRKLQRELEALRAIDFFPGDASAEAEAAWLELSQRIAQQLSPDEPGDSERSIARLDRTEYLGRVWATRRRLWVDRVASAWLIRRFIDPEARFKWLAKPADCPKKALGFDFDGAAFTHVGDRVTFETLLASFGLEDDPGLKRLGALVHQLDIGGEPVPEAPGFEATLSGARERLDDDDDALLAEMTLVLDSLYAHYRKETHR